LPPSDSSPFITPTGEADRDYIPLSAAKKIFASLANSSSAEKLIVDHAFDIILRSGRQRNFAAAERGRQRTGSGIWEHVSDCLFVIKILL
jgi:hypothetical protein